MYALKSSLTGYSVASSLLKNMKIYENRRQAAKKDLCKHIYNIWGLKCEDRVRVKWLDR